MILHVPASLACHCLHLTYTDNFDGPTNYWAQEGNVWERGAPAQTTLNGAYSAPNAWMTKLSANYPTSTDAYLYSPFFDVSNVTNATLKFRHKHKIVNGDGGSVQYSTDGGQTWILLGYMMDPLATNWYNAQSGGNHFWSGNQTSWTLSTYDLSTILASVSTPIQFRFYIMSNASGTDEGWLIDDFSIELPAIQFDGGVVAIPQPDTSIIGANVTVSATVKNFGTDPLLSIPIEYDVNGGTPVQETWVVPSPGLSSGDTMTYTFNTGFTSPGTTYNLCVRTNIAGDTYTSNDELCKNVAVTAAPLDAGVTLIVAPGDTAPLYTPNTVTIRIKNFGTQALTTLDVQYQINSATPVVETWTGGPLAMGDSVDYTFQTSYNSPLGSNYQLCAKTMLTGDADATNDEYCKTIIPDGIVEELANGMKLWQNMPNPASENTVVRFEIPSAGMVSFEIVDILGNTLMNTQEKKIAGIHTIEIDVNSLANGVYYYSVEFDGNRLTKQMIINK
jgi:hypothetical protein